MRPCDVAPLYADRKMHGHTPPGPKPGMDYDIYFAKFYFFFLRHSIYILKLCFDTTNKKSNLNLQMMIKVVTPLRNYLMAAALLKLNVINAINYRYIFFFLASSQYITFILIPYSLMIIHALFLYYASIVKKFSEKLGISIKELLGKLKSRKSLWDLLLAKLPKSK